MSIKQSDQILVQSYLSGDEAAFEVLIRKHKDKVFAFILSKLKNYNLAHDVFQDTFIKVINSLKRGKYNEEGKFVPWVMRIAHNLVIDHFRRQKKTRSIAPTKDFDIFDVIINENRRLSFIGRIRLFLGPFYKDYSRLWNLSILLNPLILSWPRIHISFRKRR